METVTEYIHNGVIFMTFCNNGYTPYTINLYKSLQKAYVPWKLLIIAIDEQAHDTLAKHDIPSILYTISGTPNEFVQYNDIAFSNISFIKLALIREVLVKADYVVYMDGDVWVYKDFEPYLNAYKHFDITFQCDEDIMGYCSKPCKNLCTGFMMLKNTPDVLRLLDCSTPQYYIHDQDYINKVIKDFNIVCGTFDRYYFPNGVYVADVNDAFLILHYNYLVGSDKQMKMQQNYHWL